MHSDHRGSGAVGLFQRNPSPLAKCKIAAGKNGPAGELLHQLIYRFHYGEALVTREGELWVAQAVRCWKDELAMSAHQLNKALERLVKLGLVIRHAWALSKHNPVRITHLKLTDKAHALFPRSTHSKEVPEAVLTNSGGAVSSIVDLSSAEFLGNRSSVRGFTKDKYKPSERNEGRRESGSTLNSKPSEQEEVGKVESDRDFEDALADLHGTARQPYGKSVEELVAEASSRSLVGLVGFRGKSKAAYTDLLEQMRERARATFLRTGLVPILPEEAFVLGASSWAEFRNGYMSERGDWPFDFVPQFAVYKAELMYDFAAAKKHTPPPDDMLKKMKAATL